MESEDQLVRFNSLFIHRFYASETRIIDWDCGFSQAEERRDATALRAQKAALLEQQRQEARLAKMRAEREEETRRLQASRKVKEEKVG